MFNIIYPMTIAAKRALPVPGSRYAYALLSIRKYVEISKSNFFILLRPVYVIIIKNDDSNYKI